MDASGLFTVRPDYIAACLAQIDGRLVAEAERDRLAGELATLTREHNLLHTRFTLLRVKFRRLEARASRAGWLDEMRETFDI